MLSEPVLASVAFLLNIATMALIKSTSALTLNVAGVFKDVGLILWSVAVSGATVTRLQYGGYTVAIVGVSRALVTQSDGTGRARPTNRR